jgi:general secretion pathway protein E
MVKSMAGAALNHLGSDADAVTDHDAALGEALVERGILDRRALERALRVRAESREGLTALLPKLGLVAERELAAAIALHLGLPLVGPEDYPAEPLLADKVSVRFLRDSRVLPIAEDEAGIAVAMADPLDAYARDAIGLLVGREVRVSVAVPAELEAAIDRLYGGARTAAAEADMADGLTGDASLDTDVERLKDLASEAPVIRLVNQLVTRAVEARASDIHIEPFESGLRIRFRIDGLLREVETLPLRLRAAVVSRVKIMARLNIAERRLPQDGRIKIAIRGTPIDLRVAVVPTMHGEEVVLRVLHREAVPLDFESLGISGRSFDTFLDVLERPNGILLVTGPTGSGKTTTLYASLARLNTPEKKILTVEDPVEYELAGINQVHVHPSIGLDFAAVLRSLLRHDPDVIMVGEIRDRETAEIAVQAALTGHLVLSTLHTNSAAGSVTRLLDMGVADYLLTSTLNGAVGQRLVRTLCRNCREPYRPIPELTRELGFDRLSGGGDVRLWRAKGCDACGGAGFRGRTTIFETLMVTDAIRRLILRRAETHELHRTAVADGMRTMHEDGLRKALAGVTTVEEVLKVTRET